MSQADDHYTYRIVWSEEDKEYVGLRLEFPSLSWLARGQEVALQGIRKVVAESVADMRKHGENPPEPRGLTKEKAKEGRLTSFSSGRPKQSSRSAGRVLAPGIFCKRRWPRRIY